MPDDDPIYATVADEISQGQYERATLARSLADSGGNEAVAKSLYVRYRVLQLNEKQEQVSSAGAQAREQARQLGKARLLANESVLCPYCSHVGMAKSEARGSMILGLFLSIVLFPFGLIYFLFYSGYRYTCANCGKELYADLIRI